MCLQARTPDNNYGRTHDPLVLRVSQKINYLFAQRIQEVAVSLSLSHVKISYDSILYPIQPRTMICPIALNLFKHVFPHSWSHTKAIPLNQNFRQYLCSLDKHLLKIWNQCIIVFMKILCIWQVTFSVSTPILLRPYACLQQGQAPRVKIFSNVYFHDPFRVD